jgi:HSP20 family molecular chaperone IbpA
MLNVISEEKNMSHVAVAKIHEGKAVPGFFTELKELTEKIRDRAFTIFQKRDATGSNALADWLQAERDLTCATESDLVEKDSEFQLRLAVPGFAEKDLKVTALADALIVSAEAAHHHEKDEGNVHFCEFSEKQLFRRFNLPKSIDADKVTAHVDKGILRIIAVKAEGTRAAVKAEAGRSWN